MHLYAIGAALVVALSSLAASGVAGWHARAVIADRDHERSRNVALTALAEKQTEADARAREYIAKRDALKPAVRVVRVAADPIVRVLDSCALPADAGKLLQRAADLADGAPDRRPDGAGPAPARRTGHGG